MKISERGAYWVQLLAVGFVSLLLNGLVMFLVTVIGRHTLNGRSWAALIVLSVFQAVLWRSSNRIARASVFALSFLAFMLWNHFLDGTVLWANGLALVLLGVLYGLIRTFFVSRRGQH